MYKYLLYKLMDFTLMFLHLHMALFVFIEPPNTLASVSDSEQMRQLRSYQKETSPSSSQSS